MQLPSADAEMHCVLSLLILRAFTAPLCSDREEISAWCDDVTFQILTLPLAPPDTMRHGDRPSLSAMASAVTCPLCASGITNLILPVSGKNARILPSSQPLTSTDPVGDPREHKHSKFGTWSSGEEQR